MSDFFEPPPRVEEEPEPSHEWGGPPPAAVPATVPVERVVARNDAAAVYLASLSAYPTGFTFDMFVFVAEEGGELDPFDFEYEMLAQRTGEIPAGKLRLGFLFADDSKATNTGAHFDWHDESGKPPDAPIMRSRRGRSDGRLWHNSFWVWPLPPPGKLEFLCEWPAAGIPLTRSELDAGAVAEASTRALRLFPDN